MDLTANAFVPTGKTALQANCSHKFCFCNLPAPYCIPRNLSFGIRPETAEHLPSMVFIS